MDRLAVTFGIPFAHIAVATLADVWSLKRANDTGSFVTARPRMGATVIGILMLSIFAGSAATIAWQLGMSIQSVVWIIGAATILYVTLGRIRGVCHSNLIYASSKYIGLIGVAVVGWHLLQFKPDAIEMILKTHFSPTGAGVSTVIARTLGNIGAVFSTQYVVTVH